jgi:hypothetical protein
MLKDKLALLRQASSLCFIRQARCASLGKLALLYKASSLGFILSRLASFRLAGLSSFPSRRLAQS